MKKSILALAGLWLITAVSVQAMNFYRNTEDGSVWLESTSCQDVNRLAAWTNQNEKTQTQPPAASIQEFHEQEFAIAQEKLIAFVREVNWKTGLHLTLRDANFFQRLKIVCTGVTMYAKPFLINIKEFDPDADQHLQQLEDGALDLLEKEAVHVTFSKMAKLSLNGIYNAIITDKPFLLLLIDEETYKSLVEMDKNVEELADNLYKFFTYRAIYMGEDYNKNTKDLIRIAKLGQGDSVRTWALMATFAEKMYQLESQSQDMTPEVERNIHIWRLNAAIEKLKHQVAVEKKAAKIAAKDPENKQWLEEQNQKNPKKPSLDQEARQMLERLSSEQLKKLLEKYLGK